MKLRPKTPPRVFTVGARRDIHIADVGDLHLAPDEQITLVTDSGGRLDVARKNWGFYATPSVNARLRQEGFKTALVESEVGRLYIMVVDVSQLAAFEDYCRVERQTVLRWLDEHPETPRA